MRIGIPKEVIKDENRVSVTPATALTLTRLGHELYMERNAGQGINAPDAAYVAVGVKILDTAAEVWAIAEAIMKVKEPQPEEYGYLREGLIIFTYLHLAANEALVDELVANKVVAIAYETVEEDNHNLPLLTPMSEVAGRMAIQEGSLFLNKNNGGKGLLLEGVPGVAPGKVVVVGGGKVGDSAVRSAIGRGAHVSVLDTNLVTLKHLSDVYGSNLTTIYSNPFNLASEIAQADLVVGTVLIPGSKTPAVITDDMVQSMEPGSVIVDVAIDQGGCVEGIHPTTHDNPVYLRHGVLHYAVTNIPGAVPRTSTYALTNATSRYMVDLANKGWKQAAKDNLAFRKGINIAEGHIVYPGVAKAFGREYTPIDELLD